MVLAFKLFPKHRETISDLSGRYQSFQEPKQWPRRIGLETTSKSSSSRQSYAGSISTIFEWFQASPHGKECLWNMIFYRWLDVTLNFTLTLLESLYKKRLCLTVWPFVSFLVWSQLVTIIMLCFFWQASLTSFSPHAGPASLGVASNRPHPFSHRESPSTLYDHHYNHPSDPRCLIPSLGPQSSPL